MVQFSPNILTKKMYVWFLLQSRSVWMHRNSFCHYTGEFSECRKCSVLSTAEHLVVNEDQKLRWNRVTHGGGGGREDRVSSEVQRCQPCRQRPAKGLCSHRTGGLTSAAPPAAAAAQTLEDLVCREEIRTN